jgi:transcriptional regulator with XRE-family HTH domain
MKAADLKAWRASHGWSQKRAAEEIGISERSFLAYEKAGAEVPRYVYLSTYALDALAKETA